LARSGPSTAPSRRIPGLRRPSIGAHVWTAQQARMPRRFRI